MKLNIFKIPMDEVDGLRDKLETSGMSVVKTVEQAGWTGNIYFSEAPEPTPIPWAESLGDLLVDVEIPQNISHFASLLFTKGRSCFVLSYGKSHFYIRPFCDYDFGIELAKRIANEEDTKQTASKRFAGTMRKDIRSFTANTRLDVASGESVEYLRAAVIASKQAVFGKTAMFGTSAQLFPDIEPAAIGSVLEAVEEELATDERFKIARTTLITDADQIAKFDSQLIQEVRSIDGSATDFTSNSYDLYGVDFVFGGEGRFTIRCPGHRKQQLEELTMAGLRSYITDRGLTDEEILRIKIGHEHEDSRRYSVSLKQDLDFIADQERVVLEQGRWMRFNQDYLDTLDNFLREIPVEAVEPEFEEIALTEPEFNASTAISDTGYISADKDFSIFKTRVSTPIEAWDLQKDDCVYAVKFGTAQRLGYVCAQARTILELKRNHAGIRELPGFKRYCIWLGYEGRRPPSSIADTGSIILKQQVESWARLAHELNIEPVVKISRKVSKARKKQR